ncbi:hypothetical protein [Pseudosporangium ferrugineum]|uniref:hypothetical protein n=1 Tax=Pseudosporangium ferrugineum TaxID=439699 RepID=UPI000D07AB3B|nr:hypothetical protein [Pseudosporangium ferrugineum]
MALVAAIGLVLAAAVPAHADSYSSFRYLLSGTNNQCMATDWSTRVYTYDACTGPQRWRYGFLDAYPGQVIIRNEATGLCVMQFDFTRVISAACDGSNAGHRWIFDNRGFRSANTGGYLGVNSSGTVRLGSYQEWFDFF